MKSVWNGAGTSGHSKILTEKYRECRAVAEAMKSRKRGAAIYRGNMYSYGSLKDIPVSICIVSPVTEIYRVVYGLGYVMAAGFAVYLIIVRILRRCIFFRPGASFFFSDSCPMIRRILYAIIVSSSTSLLLSNFPDGSLPTSMSVLISL